MNNRPFDNIYLLNIIKHLCTKKIRQPITMEQTKAWLKQFTSEPEKTLGLLILRHLIYRTTTQLDSSLKQALKAAALHFAPESCQKENVDWRDILNGRIDGLEFSYGPPKQSAARPGKSGEIISRQLKFCDPSSKFKLSYPDRSRGLTPKQRYLLIDDGTFTGSQLSEFLSHEGDYLTKGGQCGIVVGFAHSDAIEKLKKDHQNVPIFFGELITKDECFEKVCENWVEDKTWPYVEITPLELYGQIVSKAKFSDLLSLGFGELGCMVAYEHGIPDNSLQLLWESQKTGTPLSRGKI